MFCQHCGAQLHDGARFCDKCGTAVGASAPAAAGTPEHHFDANDALAMGGLGVSALGRGGGGDIAGYMMSKAALENLEESGQGDSAMADMARAGMTITKIKIIVGIVVAVIVLIIFLVVLSKAHQAQDNFNNNLPGNDPLSLLAIHASGVVLRASGRA